MIRIDEGFYTGIINRREQMIGEKAIIIPQGIRYQIIVDEETGRLYKLERFEDKRLVLSEVKLEELMINNQ